MCGNSIQAADTINSRLLLANQAIEFASERLEPWEVQEFLSDFRHGELTAWPEFVTFAGGFTIKDVAA